MSGYSNINESEVERDLKHLMLVREAELECLRDMDPEAAASAERQIITKVELVDIIAATFEGLMELGLSPRAMS